MSDESERENVPQGQVKYADALAMQVADVTRIAKVVSDSLGSRPLPAPRKPVLMGMGASYAALGAAEHALRRHGSGALRVVASDFDAASFDFSDLIIALSQSGKSKETIEAVQASGQPTLAVVNVAGSPLTRACSAALDFGSVPDSLASTTGYTGSLVAMGMLTDSWITGRPDPAWLSLGERLGDFEAGFGALAADLVAGLSPNSSVDVVGSGGYAGAAQAGALLLREVSTMPAAAFTGRQYLHGPMEAWPGVGHLIIGGTDTWLVAKPLAERGHPVTILAAAADPAWQHRNVRVIPLPARSVAEEYAFAGLLLQHVAAGLAAARSADPDEFLFLSSDTKIDAAEPCPS
jgi:glucosamine--fructose-6-phosphate aminotransferase (isomerizing)